MAQRDPKSGRAKVRSESVKPAHRTEVAGILEQAAEAAEALTGRTLGIVGELIEGETRPPPEVYEAELRTLARQAAQLRGAHECLRDLLVGREEA